MTIEEVNAKLFALAEEKNAKRSGSITPGAKPILGARIPELRKLAKQIAKENYREFLAQCPDDYFEQQALQGLVIGYAKDEIEKILFRKYRIGLSATCSVRHFPLQGNTGRGCGNGLWVMGQSRKNFHSA